MEKNLGDDFLIYLVEDLPLTFRDATLSPDAPYWKDAIADEMNSIYQNGTWILSDLPPGIKAIGCKWIFKKKLRPDGTVDKYKARLVAKGYSQKAGFDYFDIYSPVVRISSIRLLIALASVYKMYIHQMDVKTAFLNGDLAEEIYMEQPEGYVVPGQEHKFITSLKDNLNAEVALGTVTNVKEACTLLGYTYLFIRMRANPLGYGISWDEVIADPSLISKQRSFIVDAAHSLDKAKMTRFDENSGNFYCTELGCIVSHFYLQYSSVETYNEMLRQHMNDSESLKILLFVMKRWMS